LTPTVSSVRTEVKFCPEDTLKEGVYVCGLAHSPSDVSETIVQAQAAAQGGSQWVWAICSP
jgi:heterodisulfide reductase subunit A-like polyferredoxin